MTLQHQTGELEAPPFQIELSFIEWLRQQHAGALGDYGEAFRVEPPERTVLLERFIERCGGLEGAENFLSSAHALYKSQLRRRRQ